MTSALEFAREMIAFDSVSSRSNVPITERIQDWLTKFGFEIERVDYHSGGIPKANLISKLGTGSGGFAYFAHTDVVPAEDWRFDDHGPFDPTVKEGRLYGRGSTDMKGSLACMLAAVSAIAGKPLAAPIYIGCTADEEIGMVGAKYVAERSELYREMVAGETRTIIGEPTRLGVVHAHKGGSVIVVTSQGRAAHSSTSHGVNANWKMIPFLAELKQLHEELETDSHWQNSDFDPPTMSLNICLNDHNSAINITSAQSICKLYFRSMPKVDIEPLLDRIERMAVSHGLEIEMINRSQPFYVLPDSNFVQECLRFSPCPAPLTVSYGTDAARFGELKNCVVMGPGDIAQAHTHDEWITLDDLERGTAVYRKMIEQWCLK